MDVDRDLDLSGLAAIDVGWPVVTAVFGVGDVRRLSHHDDRAVERAVRLSPLIVWLFAQGHAVDLILVILLIEAVWLLRWRGWPALTVALRLLPGACMVLAVRAALTGMGWPWIALTLAASFPLHLADVVRSRRR